MVTEEFLRQLITEPDRLNDLVDEAKLLAFQHGFIMRTRETPNSSEVVTYALFTLFPSPAPKAAYLQALAIQTHFNTLMDKISQDPDFLVEALAGSILKSAGLSEESEGVQDTFRTPGTSATLAKAWELYGQQEAVILFLVEDVQICKLSHCFIEKELWNRNIPIIRRKFEEVSKRGSLNEDRKLFVDGLEVAVVYYRYGYMPDHYTEKTWEARLQMERSLAVKCPDISTHLAGTKKVQQVLARPGVLEKFFPDQPEVVEQIRATFAGLYTLEMGPEGDQTVAMALGGTTILERTLFEYCRRLKVTKEELLIF